MTESNPFWYSYDPLFDYEYEDPENDPLYDGSDDNL